MCVCAYERNKVEIIMYLCVCEMETEFLCMFMSAIETYLLCICE